MSTSEMTAPAADAAPAAPGTVLVLVRHAVTDHTGSILTGRAPGVALSEAGRAQADAVATRLAKLPIAALYTSPIERTAETAAAIATACGLDAVELDGVMEADFGAWTGKELGELAKDPLWAVVQRTPSRVQFPGGETLGAMQARVVAALEGVVAAHPGEVVAVVSHADPIKAAVAAYTGMHLDHFQRILISPASVTAFAVSASGALMLTCNDTGALDALAPGPDVP
jgi:probable phosphomutase (TIGR03848 family)